MSQLLQLLLFIIFGFALAHITNLQNLAHASWYLVTITSLLAMGLYASTYGIVLKEARQHLRIILSAVTIGAMLKAAIIGGSLAVIFKNPFFIVLGITVAQIDPLAVATLMKGKRLSPKAKTILASWASFDDPITIILSLYVPLILAHFTGSNWQPIAGSHAMNASFISYCKEIGSNVAYAGGVLAVWLLAKYYMKRVQARATIGLTIVVYVLLAISFSISVLQFMLLSIALIGLFLRPQHIEVAIDHIIKWAFRAAALLLGALLLNGINLWSGIALGIAAYSSQIIVGWLLTHGLPKRDRWHIAFAQQNGITAIILALLFEPVHPGTVAIVAPAVVVINSLHSLVNKLLDRYVLQAETESRIL